MRGRQNRQELAGGLRWAAAAHVLAAPCELAHGPLLDQAVVAPMVARVAIIRQRGRRGRRRRWRRRRCRRAALALSLAAESLLALRPAPLPVREARRTVIRARGGRATNVVVSAAPNLLARIPSLRGTDGTVGLRRRSRRVRSRMRCCGAADAVVLAAISLLVQAPQALALAAVRLRGRRRNVLRRRGRDDDI